MDNFDLYLALTIAKAMWAGCWFGGFIAGMFAAVALSRSGEENGMMFKAALGLAALGMVSGPGLWLFFNLFIGNSAGVAQEFGKSLHLPFWQMAVWAGMAGVGAALGVVFERKIVPAVETFLAQFKRSSLLERAGKTDVRTVEKELPKEIATYDPRKYFKKEAFFLGLDEHKKPIYKPWEMMDETHVAVTGRTRVGKGVSLQLQGYQYIAQGDLLVVLDPKGDNYMPDAFFEACAKAGKPWHFVNLADKAHQLNIMQGCTEAEMREILFSGFQLEEMGDRADFFKFEQQNQAEIMAEAETANGPCWATFAELAEKYCERILAVPKDAAKGLATKLKQAGRLASINATGGPNFAELAKTGGCLYIVGSMTDRTMLRALRMVLIRFMQIARSRNFKHGQDRPIRVIADEFAAHISNPVLMTFGVSAGWGLLLTVAFQSFQDLLRVPADVNAAACRGMVLDNTGLKLIHAIDDVETKKSMAASTGKILVDEEVRKVKKNLFQVESVDGERTIKQAERDLIDENMLNKLPKRCAVLLSAGELAQFCQTSPIIVKNNSSTDPRQVVARPGKRLAVEEITLPDDEEELAQERAEFELPEN